jgi:hypothetical protein
MHILTKEEIHRVLGPVNSSLTAELTATGATEDELREAHLWVLNDDVFVDEGRHLPTGRIAALIDILQPIEGPQTGYEEPRQ